MENNANNVVECLRKLCANLSDDADGAYNLAISYLSSDLSTTSTGLDEPLLCQRVRSRLSRVSLRDADKFTECYQKVKNSLVLKQRASVLALLYALSADPSAPKPTSDHQLNTQQLFPLPTLATSKSGIMIKDGGSSASKTSIDSTSWYAASAQQKPSYQNLPVQIISSAGSTSERECLRAAVMAAMGVRSRSLSTGTVSRPAQALFARIAHLGFLHDRLKEFIDPTSGLNPHGLMGEGLISAVSDELTEYYRSVALLQSQSQEGSTSCATLRRLSVWAQEPLHRLTWLVNITHAANHKKGGELASCVHRFVRHGDELVAALARRLLTSLTYPLLLMLTRWLLHGEIDDPFNEFFVECRSGVPIDRMWHDKFRVREWMVPSFMGREQAAQILATGKSVVFMREACTDEPEPSAHAHHLQALLHHPTGAESGAWWEAAGLQEALAAAHRAASRRLLASLITHHHLLDHLHAHRRYLLLAQGDFHHHLMTLVQDELNKSASTLYVHNLTCTLEAAVRATNAQFEPPHVLARLHVNLFPSQTFAEDSGWDVFALQYRVDGPLGTLFPATCAAQYRALFTQLWRLKRIEYCLHSAWREHAILQKRLRYMPEVSGLVRRVSCVRAEALRLCGALQEAGFVGAAPAWQELLEAAAAQRDLDDLLALHHAALQRQAIDAMIHHSTQELQSYLGNVLEEILALHKFEMALNNGLTAELDRRDAIDALKAERTARGEYATTVAEEADDKEKRKIFQEYLAGRKADLSVLARSYRGHVKTLILKLALHTEVSLQTLAFRLDYSDFYKRGDSKLHEPLTYQHKRLSEIGINLAKQTKLAEKTMRRK